MLFVLGFATLGRLVRNAHHSAYIGGRWRYLLLCTPSPHKEPAVLDIGVDDQMSGYAICESPPMKPSGTEPGLVLARERPDSPARDRRLPVSE